jgi:hypothetical protein
MLKININSAPRITPSEETQTQEKPVEQKMEQQTPRSETTLDDGSTIDTGDGNDIVMNTADRSTIITGGNDQVSSSSDQTKIHTGSGDDLVDVYGQHS